MSPPNAHEDHTPKVHELNYYLEPNKVVVICLKAPAKRINIFNNGSLAGVAANSIVNTLPDVSAGRHILPLSGLSGDIRIQVHEATVGPAPHLRSFQAPCGSKVLHHLPQIQWYQALIKNAPHFGNMYSFQLPFNNVLRQLQISANYILGEFAVYINEQLLVRTPSRLIEFWDTINMSQIDSLRLDVVVNSQPHDTDTINVRAISVPADNAMMLSY